MKASNSLGGELEEIGAPVDIGDDIDRVDDPRVGHAEGHDGFDWDQFVWVRGDVGEEVPAHALDRVELGFVEDQCREFLPRRAQGDEVGLYFLPGEGIGVVHAAVEYHGADQVLRSGGEDLAQCSQGDLGDDALIELSHFRDWPECRLDDLARLDVPEQLEFRDDINQRQVPLHGQQGRFWYVPGAALSRELGRVGRLVQDNLDVLADCVPVVFSQAGLELVEMGIVSVRLALRLGGLLVVRLARLAHLPVPPGLLVPMIGLGLGEYPPGFFAGRLVTRLTAEHSPERPWRFGLEVWPLRSGERPGKLA
jgi:hypothetical protein